MIDVNSDVAEGFGHWRLVDDGSLLRIVSSANVACGFHAGDPTIMRRACDVASVRGVAIGAHVGFRDLAGFGRRRIDCDPGELADEVLYQISALDGFARRAGSAVSYVKPHGALYHAAWHDERQARAVVSAVLAYGRGLAVLGPPGSAILRTASRAGLRCVAEGFADRRYTSNGTLVPRGVREALLTDPEAAAEQAVRLAVDGKVRAVDGSVLEMPVESICVHGDTPGAVNIADGVRAGLARAGVVVRPFIRDRPGE